MLLLRANWNPFIGEKNNIQVYKYTIRSIVFNLIHTAELLNTSKIPLWLHLGCDESGVRSLVLHVVVVDSDVHVVEDVESVFVVKLGL